MIRIYLKYISLTFQKALAYRLEYFTSLLNALLYIFIFVSVWRTLFAGKIHNGLTAETMTSYAILATIIKATFTKTDSYLASKIRTGEIAVELMKPYSLALIYLSDLIGNTLYQIFSRGIPLLFFSMFIFHVDFSIDGERIVKFLPLYLFSFVLYYLLSLFLSSFSFFFVETFSFWILYFALVTLLSGAIIPLDLFPESIRYLITYTPFPYLYYFPTMILLRNDVPVFSYPELIMRYIIQIVAVFFPAYGLYRLGLRKLTVAGG